MSLECVVIVSEKDQIFSPMTTINLSLRYEILVAMFRLIKIATSVIVDR